MLRPPPSSTLFPYTTLFRSRQLVTDVEETLMIAVVLVILVIFLFLRSASATLIPALAVPISLCGTFAVMYLLDLDRKSTRLNSSHVSISYAVFCLKKKNYYR